MKVVSFIIVVAIVAFLAKRKGFNPWLWLLTAGLPGLIVLACMPSSAAKGLDATVSEKRRRIGNMTGAVITGLMILIGIVVVIVFHRMQP